MGLKCSLLGHSFDETDVEREREERGSEVVTIIREVERCGRCGKTRTVSENKEVTSIIEPDEAVDPSPADDEGVELDEAADPEEEDAEILTEERTTERTPGQWPDDDEPWEPGADGADEAADVDAGRETDGDAADDAATAVEDDAVDGAGATDGDASSAGDRGAAPGEDDHAEVLDDGAAGGGPGVGGDGATGRGSSDGGEIIDAGGGDRGGDADDDFERGGGDSGAEFVCPECGFAASASSSSLRAGDACPECQRGYLEADR